MSGAIISVAWCPCEILRAARPSRDLVVFPAPFDFVISPDTALQPDVLVARRGDIGRQRLDGVPLLVVEVQSASTRRIDRVLKRAAYEQAGVPVYWLVDPEVPSLTVLQLKRVATYEQVAHIAGDEAYVASDPFPVTVVPARLLED